MAPGTYNYELSAPGLKTKNGSLELTPEVITLRDTLEVEYYKLELRFLARIDGKAVEGVEVTLGDSVKYSGADGRLDFSNLLYGNHTLHFLVPDSFNPLEEQVFGLSANHSEDIQLAPRSYLQSITIRNAWNSEALSGVLLKIDGQTLSSDYYGTTSLSLIPGAYPLSISLTRFTSVDTTLISSGEERHSFTLKQSEAEARFRVFSKGSALGGVSVVANGDTLETGSTGLATFRKLPTYTPLELEAFREGYAPYSSLSTLGADTIITLHMQLATSIETGKGRTISLYPNPVSSTLTIAGVEGTETLLISDLCGRIWINTKIQEKNARIDLSHLPSGVYLLRLQKQGILHKLLKN